jgi:hypothetical protein
MFREKLLLPVRAFFIGKILINIKNLTVILHTYYMQAHYCHI